MDLREITTEAMKSAVKDTFLSLLKNWMLKIEGNCNSNRNSLLLFIYNILSTIYKSQFID